MQNYFKPTPIAIPAPTAVPNGYSKCKLPISCDGLWGTPILTPRLPQVNATEANNTTNTTQTPPHNPDPVPNPDHDGKDHCKGYKPYTPQPYVPSPIPIVAPAAPITPNKTVSDEDAKKQCASVCADVDIKALGIHLDVDYYVNSCIADVKFSSAAISISAKACYEKAYTKAKDVYVTSTDPIKVDNCKKTLVADDEMTCQNGGISVGTGGCQCTPNYQGKHCETYAPVPAVLQPAVKQLDVAQPQTLYQPQTTLPQVPAYVSKELPKAPKQGEYSSAAQMSGLALFLIHLLQ
eukprot:NODE_236_length_11993_cov_1.471078.p3 type:complete len:293 gc:universal NODE_236_length_11993_cov_1.471078:224-1102(+)